MTQDELIQQWNSVHGAAYSVRDHDLIWNLTKQSLVEYHQSKIGNTPVLLARASDAGVAAGLPSKNMWLSLWGKIENHKDFVSQLLEIKKSWNKAKLFIGGDEFHLIPSLPLSEDGKKLKQALDEAGFQGSEAADYFGNINSNEVTKYISRANLDFSERELSFKEVSTPEDIFRAEEFLKKEFPGRWTREFQFWASREDTQRAFWKLLRTNENEVIGFARMAVRGRVTPLDSGWTPGALRVPTQLVQPAQLSAKDCCLGPIGVASSQRGKGTGKVLLGLVLESLRNYPTDRICIDWTNAFKYYEPLNFEVARRYWVAWIADQ